MTIGPLPMISIDVMSVRFGIDKSRVVLGTQKPDGSKHVRFISHRHNDTKIFGRFQFTNGKYLKTKLCKSEIAASIAQEDELTASIELLR